MFANEPVIWSPLYVPEKLPLMVLSEPEETVTTKGLRSPVPYSNLFEYPASVWVPTPMSDSLTQAVPPCATATRSYVCSYPPPPPGIGPGLVAVMVVAVKDAPRYVHVNDGLPGVEASFLHEDARRHRQRRARVMVFLIFMLVVWLLLWRKYTKFGCLYASRRHFFSPNFGG